VLVQHWCRYFGPLCGRSGWQGGAGMSTLLGVLLRCLGRTYRLRRRRRDFYPSTPGTDHLIQLGLLRSRIVSTTFEIPTDLSVVFQWSVSYMISPDAANMGVKAIYIWAAMLVPTTVLLWLFYPEVSPWSP